MAPSRSPFCSTDVSGESLPPAISSHLEDLFVYEEIVSYHSSSPSTTEETFQEFGDHGSNLRVFRHVLKRLWREDLSGKEHAERHLRHKYRRNCKPQTLLGTLTTLKLFLGFLKKAGRTRLEEITREDLEAGGEKNSFKYVGEDHRLV